MPQNLARLKSILRKNILAFKGVVEKLNLTRNIVIIGGAARYLCGKEDPERVGDVDAVVSEEVASRYWEFTVGLLKAGYRPVYDVLGVEKQIGEMDIWEPVQPTYYAHLRAFRFKPKKYGCEPKNKHANLDIVMSKNILESISGSERWVHLIEKCQRKPRCEEIKKSHKYLLKNLPSKECINRVFGRKLFSKELRLFYSPTEKKRPPAMLVIRCKSQLSL